MGELTVDTVAENLAEILNRGLGCVAAINIHESSFRVAVLAGAAQQLAAARGANLYSEV